jgi:pyruvate,water dikinase
VEHWVLNLEEVDQTQVALVGGKGAHLGELSRIDGVRVPSGFCVTTDAFRHAVSQAPALSEQLDRLSQLEPDEQDAIRELSSQVRHTIEAIELPAELASAIERSLVRLGADGAYAVRSSATAEDSPATSFAGQHDTFLNVVGHAAVLEHVTRCWASLFSERAVTYRLRNGVDNPSARMAVVVQKMIAAQAAGVLFTADPATGNRKVSAVEASFGLGEALVSGLTNADVYRVRDGRIVSREFASKGVAIDASPTGGTRKRAIDPAQQSMPALNDAQVIRLAELGRRIEAHLGRPQDIEWCLFDDDFYIVQARPITTLFPIPKASDNENRVYLSTGHQQMMTDAIKPLGISVRQLTGTVQFHEAGGRWFVDVTRMLASPAGYANLQQLAGKSDPLTGDALRILHERGFVAPLSDGAPSSAPPPRAAAPAPIETDPRIVDELIQRSEESIAALEREIRAKSGVELLDLILADQDLKRTVLDPRSNQVIMAGMEAAWWLNDQIQNWLGEKNVADTLTQSVPNNVTSEMGLALLDVADVVRPRPDVVAFLQQVESDDFLDALPSVPGGREARAAIVAWLDKYGMRCVGEIDITRPRWAEHPSAIVPMILGNVKNFEQGAGRRRFEQGLQEAEKKEQQVLRRVRALPDGERKADETKRMIDRVRTFAGYREYPKYAMVKRYFIYKKALLNEADRLVRDQVLADREDIYYLSLQELREVVRTHRADEQVISRRKEEFRVNQTLTPPRVITSEGEAVSGSYRREDLPAGALVGLAVSAGMVEGRARVVLDVADARLEPGDVLVTTYADPSWTPLFVAIAGLVTEVGGLMTHGAVIAREYGLPAVVGVENATRLIRDGQRVRVHGTEGYVEFLSQVAVS